MTTSEVDLADSDAWGFTAEDESELSDIVAGARLAGMITGTGRFSRAILAAGYRRTMAPSPRWELRGQFADQAMTRSGSRSSAGGEA